MTPVKNFRDNSRERKNKNQESEISNGMRKFLLGKAENFNNSLRDFLGLLFKNEVIRYLLYPRISNNNDVIFQCLVKDQDHFKRNGIFLPVMPVNSAKVISDFSFQNFKDKVGVIIRPCEAKAVIELIKLKQIERADLVMITFDCLGIVNPGDFQEASKNYQDIEKLKQENISKYLKGETVFAGNLRKSCQACVSPLYEGDIHIGTIGMDRGISISLKEEIYEKVKEGLPAETPGPKSDRREGLLTAMVKKRSAYRDKIIEEFRDKVKNIDDLLSMFSLCMRCYNCRVACPICYCRECIFATKVFEHSPATFKKWLEKKDAVKLPTDTLLFHLTRLNHMSLSCVGCGYCSSACPHDLPVFELFLTVGSELQKIFDYQPGRSLEDPIPLTEFKEKELENIES